ncbi:MAG: hypothetical protein ACRBBN_13460 [Methyloligellaceae bacterium]
MWFEIHPGKWADARHHVKLPINNSTSNIPTIKFIKFKRNKNFYGGINIVFEITMPSGSLYKPDEVTLLFQLQKTKHKYDPFIFIDPYRANELVSGKPVLTNGKYLFGWYRNFSPTVPVFPFKSSFKVKALLPDGTITQSTRLYAISNDETDQCFNRALALGTPLYKFDAHKGIGLRQRLYKSCQKFGLSQFNKNHLAKCRFSQRFDKFGLKWLYHYPEC